MATSGKEFITNFRNVRLNPFLPSSSPSLITRGDIQKARQKEYKQDLEFEAAEQAYIEEKTKQTEPLRTAIKEASGGKVLVDKSIYDKAKLERILNSIKEMQGLNNGALQPPYVVISDGVQDPTNLGEASYARTYRNRFFPFFEYQLSPSDTFNGTKNSPYRIGLRDANNTPFDDYAASEARKAGWTVEKPTENGTESVTHAHELAHTAYFDALKKTQNPTLPGFYNKAKIEEFRQTHPSLQEIFDIAARNTGYDNIQDAASTISRYALQDAKEDNEKGGLNASANWGPNYKRLAELFAEAYTDYIYNKENASDYSKEIIRLYVDYINDYNKTFDEKIALSELLRQPEEINNDKFVSDFINNLRKASNK